MGSGVEEMLAAGERTAVQPLLIHLVDVGYVDEKGKELLAEIHSRGHRLEGRGVMVRHLVAEITEGTCST
jgi:hypothetical protein